jgi:adenylosuccinate synthase
MMDFIKPGRAAVVLGGQFGSEGKGLAESFIGVINNVDWAVTNSSPNAGHTSVVGGVKKVARHLPTAALWNPKALAYLGPQSAVDPDVLREEIEATGFDPSRLYVHPRAAVVDTEDRVREMYDLEVISSTMKGSGAVRARKLMRHKAAVASANEWRLPGIKIMEIDFNDALRQGARVLISLPQGFSLSLDGPFYPYCTSRNITVSQALADVAVHPYFLGNVMVVLRTFPIRVGSLEGMSSGGHYLDQQEIGWDQVGVKPEFTTVTKRVRRVFSWSAEQVRDCFQCNLPTHVLLNYANYVHSDEMLTMLKDSVSEAVAVSGVAMFHLLTGWGPGFEDVHYEGSYDAGQKF